MTDVFRPIPSSSLADKAATALRKYIQTNFPEGGRIPGEHDLAELLNVNRGTLRQSLQILEHEGLIIRRHGSGTYANQYVLGIRMRLEAIVRFAELVESAGYEPTRRQLGWEYGILDGAVAEQLDVPPKSSALFSRLLILADGQPAVYVKSAVPAAYILDPDAALDQPEPFFDFLPQRCGVRVSYGITEIVPRICGEELGALLDMDPHAAILQLNDLYFTEQNTPIMASWICAKDPIVRFSAIRRQMST